MGGKTRKSLYILIRANKNIVDETLASLAREKLIARKNGTLRIA